MHKRHRIRSVVAVTTVAVVGAVLVGQLSTADAASSSLSGGWSGKYSGAYHGTFTLHWTQSGSQLRGTIKLSSAEGPVGLKGSVRGGSINSGPSAGRQSRIRARRRAGRCPVATRHQVGRLLERAQALAS